MDANVADADVVVAGHICLDVIPRMETKQQGLDTLLVPGKLVDIGPAVLSTGGAVSNTGIALHRLGVRTSLMGKVGDDLFGDAIMQIVTSYHERLAEGMIVAKGEHSSYTFVISPPGIDRIFLHSTGANDTFEAGNLNLATVRRAKLFHFGYPPLMRRMYENQGRELAELLRRAKAEGVTVSLDLAKPDPDSPAGRADWQMVLCHALPWVDLFLPSFEEILYMLRRERYDELERQFGPAGVLEGADGPLLRSLGDELIGMGAAVIALKLGEHGLYLRTSSDPRRITRIGRCAPHETEPWINRELLATCCVVEAAGTTGAGDCTIAGFIAALLEHGEPEAVLNGAVAVGACNVERADAVSGVPAWAEVQSRMAAGWRRRENRLSLPGWTLRSEGIWAGPDDGKQPIQGGVNHETK